MLGGEFGLVGFHKLVDGNLKKSLASLLPNHVSWNGTEVRNMLKISNAPPSVFIHPDKVCYGTFFVKQFLKISYYIDKKNKTYLHAERLVSNILAE